MDKEKFEDKQSNSKLLLRKIAFKLPALIIVITLWILSSQSTLPQLKGILGFDKLQHLTAYAALAFSLGFWFFPHRCQPWRVFLIPALIASCYGAIDEFHQYFVPGRACDVWDWIADTLGAVLGAGAFVLISSFFARERQAKDGI